MNGIRERRRDDRNCRRGLPGRNRVDNGGGQDDVGLQSDHLFGEGGQPLLVAVGESIEHVEVVPFGIAKLPHAA